MPLETPTRILVVDDDDAFRESVCAAIARDDAMVLAAQVGNAEGARAAIADGEFDAVHDCKIHHHLFKTSTIGPNSIAP